MAELASPYRHFPAYGVGYSDTVTMLKIAAAETIVITWTFHVGNNGSLARYGHQYFLLSRNMGSGRQEKLVEYAPGEGKVFDGFEEEFGVSSSIYPSWPVTVGPEPTITMYDLPVNYGVPKSYKLQIPGPFAGMDAQGGGLNRPLYDFWEEVARREAFSYLSMEFGYYQLGKDKQGIERQILPRDDEPWWEKGILDWLPSSPTHKFQNLIRVLWEEDR